MGAVTAQQQPVVEDRQPVAARDAVQDFSPQKSNNWSDIAIQCWNDPSNCASNVGKKLGETFGLGGTKEQELIKQGQLPDLKLIEGGSDTRTDGTDAVPKALQGDNKKRTETVMNAKADPQDRLKAASELINNGVTGFTVQGEDGSLNKVRLEREKVSADRSILGVYVTNKNGAELNALRAIEKADGSLVQQKDGNKNVDYRNRGAALLDRLSETGKVVETEGLKKGPEAGVPRDLREVRDQRRELVPDEKTGGKKGEVGPDGKVRDKKQDGDQRREFAPDEKGDKRVGPDGKPLPKGNDKAESGEKSEWKSPYHRIYEAGDKFKGISSVYWQDISTKSGIPFNKDDHTAASREFPFGTVLKVRNPETGKETRVVITDHGPFRGKMESRPDGSEKVHNRVLDLADGAAKAIGLPRTVKQLEITVESIPEGGKWGKDRTTLRKAEQAELLAQVKRVTREGRM